MDALLPSDPVRVGPYELRGRLGAGGMGQVYLGMSTAAEKVALKVIKPELVADPAVRRRFSEEVENLRMIYGARVARFEDAGLEDDPPWCAVEYVPGRTLRQHVELRGVLDPPLTAILGAALIEGLEKIHQVGLLHRDLKPQNILLGPDGPKVIDFGLALLLERRHERELTEPGGVVGTLAYMPPEQARGDRELTGAADVYALGATLVFAATGRSLYPGVRGYALLGHIADPAIRPDLDAVPAELASLLGAMLAFEPAARPSLDALMTGLMDVATAGGRTGARLRRRLVARTFVASASGPELYDADPREEPWDDQTAVPWGSSGSDHAEWAAEGVDAGGTEGGETRNTGTDHAAQATRVLPVPDGSGPRVGPAALPSRASVSVEWLVTRLRAEYARNAEL
ncbi:serine/threonine-protein kinase [Frankia sp. CiP1_Cm_nod1]|uniref:serine/threonine-protein kinase n=1 Tax=Frankia sp. CiP1_Cm_nod1 TaxID=2897160 RepID=UPI002024C5CC